ncbi:MAG: FAD-dependent oxidoreductase [Bacteriovoracaceae bacterium]|nr:FAD-dependent oxidoreductase [Bacteriovoracaceae bacterium]
MAQKLEFRLNFDDSLEDYVRKNYPKVKNYRILTKSLDARGAPTGKNPTYHYIIEILDGKEDEAPSVDFKAYQFKGQKPLIIGAGPAGLFAALRFAEYGVACQIVERGNEATKRMLSISRFWKHGDLDSETNVCYGEGGAGLFSDGKLISRVKSDLIGYVMQKFVDFGAPEETAYISNPHLGSNKIRTIITKMTNHLKQLGHEIYYNNRMEKILTEGKKVIGVELLDGTKLYSDYILLATGHSAHEIYYHLNELGVTMKAKDFAVGVRIEHPRKWIDQIQHGRFAESLESARYRLSYHDKKSDAGTYSFCMCPGGYVLSSGTDQDGIVVNGMSNYARNSPWSNSAIVVTVKANQDFGSGLFDGLEYQREIERKAYELSKEVATGKELPAMTLGEFIKGKLNTNPLPKSSSPSRLVKADIIKLFPPKIIQHLKQGFAQFDKNIHGFAYEDALLIAPETRTSSPITILRDKSSLESISHSGLFPCGEGAGHAGGITSAAVDGVKVVDSIMKKYLRLK